jgi:hypothetical protein
MRTIATACGRLPPADLVRDREGREEREAGEERRGKGKDVKIKKEF